MIQTRIRPGRPAATRLAAGLAAAALVSALAGCVAPILVGGAMVGGGMVATDRRTSGMQLEDQTIEFKVGSRISDLATLGHVNVTSYNRLVLLTGEVPGETERVAAEKAAARVENVRAVVNELAVAPNSSFGSRSNDTLVSTKVKATLVDAKDLQANAFKAVTERGIVYLMGMVTEREASRAAELVRGIPGVQKVVRVFEILSEDQLANLTRQAPAPVVDSASAPVR